jgi:hypothetical protein
MLIRLDVFHRDLSDNNLILWHPKLDQPTDTSTSGTQTSTAHLSSSGGVQERPSVFGIFNDWDMASELNEKGEIPNNTALHRTGAFLFMAMDLLCSLPLSS